MCALSNLSYNASNACLSSERCENFISEQFSVFIGSSFPVQSVCYCLSACSLRSEFLFLTLPVYHPLPLSHAGEIFMNYGLQAVLSLINFTLSLSYTHTVHLIKQPHCDAPVPAHSYRSDLSLPWQHHFIVFQLQSSCLSVFVCVCGCIPSVILPCWKTKPVCKCQKLLFLKYLLDTSKASSHRPPY